MEYIRKLTKEDKDKILAVCATIWDGDDYIPHVLDKWITDPNGYFVGLFEEDKLLGFGRLASHGDGNFWLEGLRKDHSLKVKGVGKKIADYLIKIAIDHEFKSLKFSTYIDNVESISLNEKIGFAKIKQWSFLEVQQDTYKDISFSDSDSLSQDITLQQFIDFIKTSSFLTEMDNCLCEGWKVYDISDEYLKKLYEKARTFAIIENDAIQAMICSITDNDDNVFVSFFDFKTKIQCQALIHKVFQHATQLNSRAVSSIVPNHNRVDCLESFGFESWEQKDDFLLFEYKGKK